MLTADQVAAVDTISDTLRASSRQAALINDLVIAHQLPLPLVSSVPLAIFAHHLDRLLFENEVGKAKAA
jgi:hypothetical protein